MLTLLGLAVLGLAGTGVAAKFGLVDYTEDVEILGQNIHVEFTPENPIKLGIS